MKQVDVGVKTTLSCGVGDNEPEFTDCRFRAPNGELHEIGISGGGSYGYNARVDCLCMVE